MGKNSENDIMATMMSGTGLHSCEVFRKFSSCESFGKFRDQLFYQVDRGNAQKIIL